MNGDLTWMSQPFAHRGLHDAGKGIVENTGSSVQAALDRGYGIEVDLRLASCGTVMVFHDDVLERLTHETGAIAARSCNQLQSISFRKTGDRMLSLQNLLDLVEGQVPVLLEIKSEGKTDKQEISNFVSIIVKTVKGYEGSFAVMSFDPSIVSAFRQLAPKIVRGLVSEQFHDLSRWRALDWRERVSRRFLLSFGQTRPDFIGYDINALPAIAPLIARNLFNRPLLTWTVRTRPQQQRAQKYCDAMIFEGFLPAQKPLHSSG